ncbi:helicase-exonuclease AddAB subunit AddA [Listeria fleischmannii]|uniref:helicase-exonuclease AddAB subunit AddA n=1 Tax=Listeria fleischmannii TaxID=1069827 RepID=UPI00162439E5|nr:helicase-exonuclease AddAB subunit AddA [Listeria fleischmannii]MBC1417660.1 helicase-exonuclease AddAB subunit AddA [Listeria fleischmannii]
MANLPAKPSDVSWTDEQWQAIYSKGQNILVAAAAGSGKTAVLVNRIIEKIRDEENPCNVDELLVVTFTNASAAEMKYRVGQALENALAENPDSLHLKKQLMLLNHASIQTLHSFCLDLIRKYYYIVNVDPDFRLMDTIESTILRDEVIETLLEGEYAKSENAPFFHLIESITDDRSDQNVIDIISRLYDFSKANPSPEKWLEQVTLFYKNDKLERIKDLPFYDLIHKDIRLSIERAIELLQQGLDLTAISGGPESYRENFLEDITEIDKLKSKLNSDWSELQTAFQQVSFGRLKPLKNKEEVDERLLKQTKKKRDQAKKVIQDTLSDWFKRAEQDYISDLEKMKNDVETLVELVQKFSKAFFQEKEKKGVLDFNDLEHLALAILSDNGRPSHIAQELRNYYKEILIDEYQDTNLVQESILQQIALPDEAKGNLFMVGDVKQSIYRFRLAEPTLFMQKYERYQTDGKDTGLRIDLAKNFRSRKEVLDTTNFIFKQIMDKEVGEIDYNKEAELVLGATFKESRNAETELLVVDMQKNAQDLDENTMAEDLQKNQAEARAIAQKIKNMIADQFPVFDKEIKQFRPIRYRDIVILSRAMTSAPDLEEAMKEMDIPFYATSQQGYFSAVEVATMISLLKIIDNPYQDIALAAVLRSPIVGLKEEELALVRLSKSKGYFFDALEAYSKEQNQTAEKIDVFLKQLINWRELSIREDLTTLISGIYDETGFFEFVGGLPGGKTRKANLQALYERAGQYEKTAFRGLFRFIRFIERLEVRGDDFGTAKVLGEKEDVVRMMTIHSSKGLEFPVVILSGVGRKFNMRDINSKVLLDKDFGFASSYTDIEKRITYPTIMQQVFRKKKINEMIAEEMRVLYVALTRAEEKLIITGTVPEWQTSLENACQISDRKEWILPPSVRSSTRNYLEWILYSLVRHPDFFKQVGINKPVTLATDMLLKVTILDKSSLNEIDTTNPNQEYLPFLNALEEIPHTSNKEEQIANTFSFEYPRKVRTQIRSKQSVTELKRQFQIQDSFSDNKFLETIKQSSLERPKFVQESQLSSTEIGTAMHTVMQSISLQQTPNEETLERLLNEMVTDYKITEAERKMINKAQILAFFHTSLGKKIIAEMPNVKREVPFIYQLPAKKVVREADETETVLIQGVVDCMLTEDDGVTIIDFKTDHITGRYQSNEQMEKVMRRRYGTQLELYKEALEAITGLPVKRSVLYFFDSEEILDF